LGGVDITGTHVRRPQRTFRPMLSATGERVSREQREDSFASLGARKLKRLDVFIENRGLMPEQAGKLWEALGMAYSAPVERDAKGDAERDFQEMAQWPFGDVGFPARVRTPGEEAAARAKFENAIRSGAVVNLDGTPVSPGVLASMCATVLGDLAEPVRKHDRDPHPRIQFHSLSNEQLDEEIQRVANFLKL
jgi:hypothetical protein